MKIRFPRFSLMTAVVMMFAASGLIWLNTAQPIPSNRASIHDLAIHNGESVLAGTERGWPRSFLYENAFYDVTGHIHSESARFLFERTPFLVDLLIALAILALVGIISETIVRRVRFKKMTNAN